MLNKTFFVVILLVALISGSARADDGRFGDEWKSTDFSKTAINLDRIIDDGPGRDGTPSVDNPVLTPVFKIDYIPDSEPVIDVTINGEARAYPLRILIWHQIVIDKIGDTPIVITYSPLCNTAIVFDRRVNGEVLQFGGTGKIYNSNMIMYDKSSQSWWQQYTGEAIVGQMLGRKLNIVTSRIESLAAFRRMHPNGKLLEPNDIIRSYGATPYHWYDSSKIPLLYDGEYKGKLPIMEYVVAVGNEAWPLKDLKKAKQIKQGDLVLQWFPYQNSVLDNPQISMGKDMGNVVALRKTGEDKYEDVQYNVTFAFVFDAFHPDGIVHEAVEESGQGDAGKEK